MSKKKGVTVSLAEFAGDAYGSSVLPTESKGVERLDSSRPSRDRPSGDRWSNDRPSGDRWSNDRPSGDRWSNDRPSGDRPMRSDRPPRDDGDRPPRRDEEENSRADETSNWRSSATGESRVPRERPSTTGESFRSSRARDFPDDEGNNWRDNPRKDLPTSSLSGGSLQPSYSSFGRSRDSKAQAGPDNWRDQLSGSGSKSEAATGGAWKPGMSRTQSATQSAEKPVEKPKLAPVAEKKTPMSWGEEEEQPQIEKPKQVKVDEEKLAAFTGRFATLLADETKKFEVFAKKAAENFTLAELKTNIPLQKATETLVHFVASESKSLEQVLATVRRCAVVFLNLQTATKDNNFEVALLVETQKSTHGKSFPRISGDCALLEALWLGLYEAQVVSAEALQFWSDNAAAVATAAGGDFGRNTALFQTQALRDWLFSESAPAGNTQQSMDWGDEEDEDVDADLQSYLSQTISRNGGGVSIKKTISASAARR